MPVVTSGSLTLHDYTDLFTTLVYIRSVSTPAAPTGTTLVAPGGGWSVDLPNGTETLWASMGRFDGESNDLVGSWGTPQVIGVKGDNGDSGFNLIKKGIFSDTEKGTWSSGNSGLISSVGGVSALDGFTYGLILNMRDNYEVAADFPVTLGEVIYWGAWVNTQATTRQVNLGFRIILNGVVQNSWATAASISAGLGWAYYTGSFTVAANTTGLRPFLQINATDTFGSPILQSLYVGRQPPVIVKRLTIKVDTSIFQEMPDKSVVPASATVSVDAATGFTISTYQWQQNTGGGWSDISGATALTYPVPYSSANPGVSIRLKAVTTGGATIYSEGIPFLRQASNLKNLFDLTGWVAGGALPNGLETNLAGGDAQALVDSIDHRDQNIVAVETLPSGTAGHWNGGIRETLTIDPAKTYILTCLVRRVVTSGSPGIVYFGTWVDFGGTQVDRVKDLAGAFQNNPYFAYDGLAVGMNYLFIGVIHPHNTALTTDTGLAGIYDAKTGKKITDGTEFKFNSAATQLHYRIGLYGAGTTVRVHFWNPTLYCNTPPDTIPELQKKYSFDLSANAAFIDTLVTNQAFIDSLASRVIKSLNYDMVTTGTRTKMDLNGAKIELETLASSVQKLLVELSSNGLLAKFEGDQNFKIDAATGDVIFGDYAGGKGMKWIMATAILSLLGCNFDASGGAFGPIETKYLFSGLKEFLSTDIYDTVSPWLDSLGFPKSLDRIRIEGLYGSTPIRFIQYDTGYVVLYGDSMNTLQIIYDNTSNQLGQNTEITKILGHATVRGDIIPERDCVTDNEVSIGRTDRRWGSGYFRYGDFRVLKSSQGYRYTRIIPSQNTRNGWYDLLSPLVGDNNYSGGYGQPIPCFIHSPGSYWGFGIIFRFSLTVIKVNLVNHGVEEAFTDGDSTATSSTWEVWV